MYSELDLLRAIVADPDADAPRLAYAEWKEDCGDPDRAEFVRIQCALAALASDARHDQPLHHRELELLRKHCFEWESQLLGLVRLKLGCRWFGRKAKTATSIMPVYHRGFVEDITLDLATFLSAAQDLSRVLPLRTLRTYCPRKVDASDLILALADCPALETVHSLQIELGCWPNRELARLLDSPHLHGLTSLCLIGRMNELAGQAMLSAGLIGRLERLELRGIGHGRTGESVLASNAIRHLRRIKLSGAELTAVAIAALPTTAAFSQLRSISFGDNPIGDFDAMGLLNWLPPTLTRLDLSETGCCDGTAASLAAAPALRRLDALNLSRNHLGDLGAMMLADSPNLLSSTQVDLRNNPITRRVRNALHVRLGHHILV